MFPIIRLVLLICVFLTLTACASTAKPDLGRLYAREAGNPNQPPLILIHGLMGSTLVDKNDQREIFPGSLGNLAFSEFRDLRYDYRVPADQQQFKPGRLITDISGVDFYGQLINVLEEAGRYERGTPGTAVLGQKPRYYIFLYDWRADNVIAVKQLHELIEQIRKDYRDPNLRVDIVAHSNGGLITNYYLRYGNHDVLGNTSYPQSRIGIERIRRVVLLGTPNLGAVSSVQRLDQGFRLALRNIPIEIMSSFATPFQTLPSPIDKPILDMDGNPVDLDIYDLNMWKKNQWSVYSPAQQQRIRGVYKDPNQADEVITKMQADFEYNLKRAKQFQTSLLQPMQSDGLQMAAFGGDCAPTPRFAVLQNGNGGLSLAYKEDEIKHKKKGVDYKKMMFEPGDGLVPRASQDPHEYGFLPTRQTFFLCEKHEFLIGNPYFQNNLLYFLLRR